MIGIRKQQMYNEYMFRKLWKERIANMSTDETIKYLEDLILELREISTWAREEIMDDHYGQAIYHMGEMHSLISKVVKEIEDREEQEEPLTP